MKLNKLPENTKLKESSLGNVELRYVELLCNALARTGILIDILMLRSSL
jgi:hypothetical protein